MFSCNKPTNYEPETTICYVRSISDVMYFINIYTIQWNECINENNQISPIVA